MWVDELGLCLDRGIVIELAGFLRGGAQDVTTAKVCQTPYFCTGCLAEPPHYYGQGLVPLIHSFVSVWKGVLVCLASENLGGARGGLVSLAVLSMGK